jgi:replicative superfamily II helicase
MLRSNRNVVVSAPTGAGKTVVLELAIVHEMMQATWNDNCKVVYMAPTKALVNERSLDWKNKFRGLGVQVTELTSDTAWMEVKSVRDATIIVTVRPN